MERREFIRGVFGAVVVGSASPALGTAVTSDDRQPVTHEWLTRCGFLQRGLMWRKGNVSLAANYFNDGMYPSNRRVWWKIQALGEFPDPRCRDSNYWARYSSVKELRGHEGEITRGDVRQLCRKYGIACDPTNQPGTPIPREWREKAVNGRYVVDR